MNDLVEEDLSITFLEEEPGDKCDNRKWDCPNEAAWRYYITAELCSCTGPRNSCGPCKDMQEKMLSPGGNRLVLCNDHRLTVHISPPKTYR